MIRKQKTFQFNQVESGVESTPYIYTMIEELYLWEVLGLTRTEIRLLTPDERIAHLVLAAAKAEIKVEEEEKVSKEAERSARKSRMSSR